jgi:hypothetical protein
MSSEEVSEVVRFPDGAKSTQVAQRASAPRLWMTAKALALRFARRKRPSSGID